MLSQEIRTLKPGGNTALYDAISFASHRLLDTNENQPTRRVIVLLSDGQDNSSHIRSEEVISDTLHSEAAIFAVTPSDNDFCKEDALCEEGEANLKSLAESTGGEFLRAAQEADLADAFSRIEKN